MTRPEIGISFMPTHNPNKLRQNAIEAGKHPFGRIAVYDDMGFPPPMIQLAEFARYTETARIGAEGIPVAKLNPDEVVGDTTFLEQLRPGNVFLGLVPGAWMEAVGLNQANIAQMREAVEVVDYLFRKDTQGYSGQKFNIQPGFQVSYPTPNNIPLVIGAYGPKMLALAGELKTVKAVKLGGTANPEMVQVAKERMAIGAQRVNRDLSDMGIVLGTITIVDRDGKKALEYAKRLAVPYIDVVGELDPIVMEDVHLRKAVQQIKEAKRDGNIDQAVKAISDELAHLFIVAGTPDQVTEQVVGIIRAGGSFEFGMPHAIEGDKSVEAEVEGIRLLGKEVLPAIQAEIKRMGS